MVACALQGCATGYGKRGITGGYSERRIDDTHYDVRFDGNGYASSDRVWYFWIFRCAQLTASRGYTYFTVSPDARPTNSSFDQDGRARLQPMVLTDRDGASAIPVAGGFIYIPGGTVSTWHAAGVVAMYNDHLPEDRPFLKASVVIDQLTRYVQTSGKVPVPSRKALLREAAYVVGPGHAIVKFDAYLFSHPIKPRTQAPLPYAPLAPPSPPPPLRDAPWGI
ncbi:CC0125/CC1285 family lipoprotein [Fulvimonas yonginensis]|uniref:DUF4136 domain-containing protein n=1 Tax=Fulvimonas yonginensis TaxID=1495200 RepID=A0ABU8JEX9_9GAMM